MPARFLICHMGIIWGAAHFFLPGPTSWAQERQFEKDILPILREHCWKCHGEEKTKGELDLRTLPAMLKGGAGSAGVVPGSLRGSGVWAKVTMDFMPPGDVKVPDKDKAVLREWILHGNFAGLAAPDIAPSMPLAKLDPLAVARAIDVDIDRRLAQAKVPASPLADDAIFLRRVYLDIQIPRARFVAPLATARNCLATSMQRPFSRTV